MTYNPESLRNRAKDLLGQTTARDNPDILNNIEKLIEEYNIHKIELELQQDELSRANQELEYKNRRLDDLFENAPVGYFILNEEGYISELNATAANMLSRPKEYLLDKPFTHFIQPASQDQFYFFWQRMMDKRAPENLEIVMATENPDQGYVFLSGLPYRDKATSKWYVRLSATNITGLKEADALRDSERRYRLLFKNMINGLLVLKPVFKNGDLDDFRFFRANAAFEQITGLNQRKMENAPLIHIFPEKSHHILPMLKETVLLSKNNKIENFPLFDNVFVNIYSFIPEEDYVALIVEDVTARKQAEKERKKSEELLSTIFKILPVGVTITDITGHIIDCNPASEELLGLKKEEHLIRNFASRDWKIIKPDLSPMPADEYASVRAHKENRIVENVEMGIVKTRNEITWINVSAAPIPLQDMGVAIVYSDITERVQAQEETEEKFRNIVQNSTDAIIIVNQSGVIIEWNKGCEIIFGYKRKSALGQKIWTFVERIVAPENGNTEKMLFSRKNILDALKSGESKWFKRINETQIKDACGKTKILQTVAFPVKSAQGYLLGVVGRDITEAKEAENMLKLAKEKAEDASNVKSQFLANISHEIRTPLNAIMGFTEILKEFPVTDKKFNSHLSGIEKSSKALMALINDILDLSRIEAGKMALNPTEFNVVSLVEDVKQIFSLKAEQKGLDLNTIIAPDVPETIFLDELRLRQILFNLVGNAVKFTNKGSITVEVQAKKKSTLYNSINMVVKVRDTGPGILEKDLEAIFDPFFQRTPGKSIKQEGTGLGLPISRRFAEMMNGKITVSSIPGRGTEFVVFIPDVPVREDKEQLYGKKVKKADSQPFSGNNHKELTNLILHEMIQTFGSLAKAREFMKEKIWAEYDKIADILGFDEVISFSQLLLDLSQNQKLIYLKEFSKKLNHEATSFNVIEINRMLTSFENLRIINSQAT